MFLSLWRGCNCFLWYCCYLLSYLGSSFSAAGLFSSQYLQTKATFLKYGSHHILFHGLPVAFRWNSKLFLFCPLLPGFGLLSSCMKQVSLIIHQTESTGLCFMFCFPSMRFHSFLPLIISFSVFFILIQLSASYHHFGS